jgi:hypothetical protein
MSVQGSSPSYSTQFGFSRRPDSGVRPDAHIRPTMRPALTTLSTTLLFCGVIRVGWIIGWHSHILKKILKGCECTCAGGCWSSFDDCPNHQRLRSFSSSRLPRYLSFRYHLHALVVDLAFSRFRFGGVHENPAVP